MLLNLTFWRKFFLKNKKVSKVESLNFYSNDMAVAKDQLAHNHLKLSYQRDSVADLDQKHKEWAQEDTASLHLNN